MFGRNLKLQIDLLYGRPEAEPIQSTTTYALKLFIRIDCGTIQVTTQRPGSQAKLDCELLMLKAMLKQNKAMIKQSINLSDKSNTRMLRPVPHNLQLKQNLTQNISLLS